MVEEYMESENYFLNRQEESKHINDINNLLNNLENLLKLNSDERNRNKIIKASLISEYMLKLLLKNQGYLFKQKTPFKHLIEFSTKKRIIPLECGKFLEMILTYRNEVAHDLKTTEELNSSFLKAFKYYITWFNNSYSSNFQTEKPFKIEPCCSIIDSLKNTDKNNNELITPELTKAPARRRGRTRGEPAQDKVFDDDKQTVCPECGSEELIGDYERAEVICAHCGLVIDENLVDMGPEWRAFDHEQRDKRTRVGAPITYTIHDKGLSTIINWRNKDSYGLDIPARNRAQWYRLRKWQRKIRISRTAKRNLAFALSELDRDSSRLGLPRSVREAATAIYRSAVDNNLIRGRKIESVVAASLYAACRHCNMPRTLDEIAEVSRVTKKEVGRTYRSLTRELTMKLPPNSPVNYVPRFATKLGLSSEAQSKAIEIIEEAMEKGLNSGKGPTGVAAAALYIASDLLGEKITKSDVADIAGISEATLNNRYDELTQKLQTEYIINLNQNFLSMPSKNLNNLNLSVDNQLLNETDQSIILEKLREQNELLKKILEITLDNNARIQIINEKINSITKSLDRIQSQTEKHIESAFSEEEIDRIIQVHTNECIENILKYKDDFIEDDMYKQEKIKLIYSFGESAWNKLSEESKTFLITSKLMYNKLLLLDEIIDYSGICVLITKALEVEIFKRFFTDFLNFLDEKYNRDYSKYHTALLFQKTTPLHPKRVTMGNIAFLLCYKENKFDTPQQTANNKAKLNEYCKSCIFSNYDDRQIKDLLNKYASSIETIRIKYRNPSAHRNKIEKIDAQECIDLIIDVEKLLKKMLDSFDK